MAVLDLEKYSRRYLIGDRQCWDQVILLDPIKLINIKLRVSFTWSQRYGLNAGASCVVDNAHIITVVTEALREAVLYVQYVGRRGASELHKSRITGQIHAVVQSCDMKRGARRRCPVGICLACQGCREPAEIRRGCEKRHSRRDSWHQRITQ